MKKGLAIGLVAVLVALAAAVYIVKQPPAPAEEATLVYDGAQLSDGLPAEATPAPVETETETDTETASAEENSPREEATAAQTGGDIDIQAAMADRVLGDADAPVTIIEYASLTCPHCAHFANTILADVKTRVVDTGRARIIFRDFPLDQHAMKAAKLSRCAPADKYYDFIEVLFRNQDRWTRSENIEKALMQYGALAGMNQTYMENCMGNAELENALLQSVSDAQSRFHVQSTPTFVFNAGAEIFRGAHEAVQFEETVNKLSAGG